ncbi:MAG TPA: hypothetical protein VM142_12660 [Acidimicrobiales bacterium]|nr:hypothetical protein [Acidimicrobiales bacterium]
MPIGPVDDLHGYLHLAGQVEKLFERSEAGDMGECVSGLDDIAAAGAQPECGLASGGQDGV